MPESRRTFLGGAAATAAATWAGESSAQPPEQPAGTYNHPYHQSLVYKIFCAAAERPDRVEVNFEEALRYIRTIHDITGGLKQIVYLVGWQFDGHDSKYPAWSEVNHRLKRPADTDARSSFLWLAEAAKPFNALVSVHVNMTDAYQNSPLWKEYLEQGMIQREKDGSLRKGGIWGGLQSYLVDKTQEWKLGYAQRRIDGLLQLLPFVRESGTVHLDAFGMIRGDARLREAVMGILDYWRRKGVDVTTEFLDLETIGRVPMVRGLNLAEENRLKYPPSVVCGGGDQCNMRNPDGRGPWGPFWAMAPDAGCLYEEAWGTSIGRDLMTSRGGMAGIVGKLCTTTLVWYYLNRHRAISNYQDTSLYRVTYSGNVESTVRKADRHLTIRQGSRTVVDGGDMFIPALWTKNEWFAYSRSGGTHSWPLPDEWKGARTLAGVVLTDNGRGRPSTLVVKGGALSIELAPGAAVAVSPSGPVTA